MITAQAKCFYLFLSSHIVKISIDYVYYESMGFSSFRKFCESANNLFNLKKWN